MIRVKIISELPHMTMTVVLKRKLNIYISVLKISGIVLVLRCDLILDIFTVAV